MNNNITFKLRWFTIKFQYITYFIDACIIFLNISNSYSIIPYLLFFQHSRIINTLIIAIINIVYLILRFRLKISFPIHSLFLLYIAINVINIISALLTDTFLYPGVAYLLTNSLFYLILYNLFIDYKNDLSVIKSFSLIFKGYIWLVILNIVSVIALFSLVHIANINPLINNIGDKMDLFTSNIKSFGASYYFPYNISILYHSLTDIRIPQIQKYGFICGFYHEPHIITFMITPALFLLLYWSKTVMSKLFILTSFISIFLISASTTNLVSVFACASVALAYKLKQNIIIPMLFILFSVFVILSLDSSYYAFIIYKFSSGSADYTMTTTQFAFTPKTILGTNFFDLSYLYENYNQYDVGYIIFILNIIFLAIISIRILFMSFSSVAFERTLGLFSLYFLIHSMKIGMVTYSLSFLLLVMFLVSISKTLKTSKHKIQILSDV